MPYYVYIIQSEADKTYYKGFSEKPLNRLVQHNNGKCLYTSRKMPWVIVYLEKLTTKREGLMREKGLKKYSHEQIQKLILSEKNIFEKLGRSTG